MAVIVSFFFAFDPHPDDLYAHFRHAGGCVNPSLAKKHCCFVAKVRMCKCLPFIKCHNKTIGTLMVQITDDDISVKNN